MIHQQQLQFSTDGRGTINITRDLAKVVQSAAVSVGLCHVFISHTSASLFINENADPSVQDDLERFMSRLVQDGDPLFTHTMEGDDDMPSHIRSLLTQTEVAIPISNGKLALGTWQGVFLWEHRYVQHQRNVLVTILG